MERDSMIIYRSFFEAIKELPKTNQAEVWNAVYELGLNGKYVELNGISKTIFTLIAPQIEANYKKFVNGSKPKTKQIESKSEAKDKQTRSKTEGNVNVNVNDNVNDKFNFYESLIKYGFDKELVKEWLQVRKQKKAVNTKTAFNSFISQVEKNGQDKNLILQTCVERSWISFKSDWIKKEEQELSLEQLQYNHVQKMLNYIDTKDYSNAD
jgi:hypothetical protein